MTHITLVLETLTSAFALWLGLYLVARNPAKALLRLAGLGLVAYALSLACDLLSAYAPTPLAATLALVHRLLIFLPALLWSGALIRLLPEDAAPRPRLIRIWNRVFLPFALLGLLLSAGADLLLDRPTPIGPGYVAFALLILLPLLAGLVLVWRARRAIRPRQSTGLLLVATLFFTLGAGMVLFPLNWLPRWLTVLAIGLDLVVLDIAIALWDAFDEGETLLPDITRSFVAALLAALLFGLQVALVIAVTGVTFPMLALLLATVAAAIVLQTFSDPVQSALDRLAFSGAPSLRQARADARAAASAIPRINTELDLGDMDEAEFTRLTRRALSHYGDLSHLASSPLTRMPLIERRLATRGAGGDPLEPAVELKALLAESVARLKPRGKGDFGTTDEWRYYNALYFPYVVGLKPYSRRSTHNGLGPADQEALDWFRAAVPERTLYNWQTTAARLVAQDIRERMKREEIRD